MKKTVTHQIEVPQDKEESAIAILRSVEASITESSSQQLQAIAESLRPKLVATEDRALAKVIAGDDYSEGSLAVLELANLKRLYESRRQLLADSISTTEVAELIGCQAITTVHDRRKASTLLGLRDNGVYKFPLWQFDPQGDDGVVDGFPRLLKSLDVSNFRKINWLTKPSRAFDGLTPIEVLKQGDPGDIEDLVIEARGVGVAQ